MNTRPWITVLVLVSAVDHFDHLHAAVAPITTDELQVFLTSKSSPLADYAEEFVAAGQLYDVDPRLVVAIAGAETSFGTHMCTPLNAWNWFWDDWCESPFDSWHEGINTVTKFLRKSYLNQGLTTIPLIRTKYCAEGCDNWVSNVLTFYRDELGGDEAYLGYPQQAPFFVLQPGLGEGNDIWTTSYYSYATCSGPGPGGGLYDATLRVGGWGDWYHSLLQFELTHLPGRASSAVLELYCFSANNGTTTPMIMEHVTEAWLDWPTTGTGCDNERLWWADRPSVEPLSSAALAAPIVGEWYVIDVTAWYNSCQAGVYENYGLQLRPTLNWNNFNFFCSSRYMTDPTLRPRLVITE